ncbi:MAG: hypothetical protein JWR81_4404 [Pseudonocardia sp.]|nr:hypothetical protein [Pseudonocardia sp.]
MVQLPGSWPSVTVPVLDVPWGSVTPTGTACPGFRLARTWDRSAVLWTGVPLTAVITDPVAIPALAASPPGTTLPTPTPAGCPSAPTTVPTPTPSSVVGEGGEVAGVEAGGVAGVVHHRPADAAAGVVLAQLDRVGPADHAVLGPVQLMAARLVRHPVLVGVPERARLQDHDPPPAARQALSKHGPARTRADDDQIDLVTVGVAAHGLFSRKVAGVHVEQEPGVVRPRPDRALEDAAPEVAHQLVPPSTSTSGSRSVAPGVSKGSREPAAAAPGPPSLMNPCG